MKKTFVALAVLAAFGSASAQVTVYGKADLGVSRTSVTGLTSEGLVVGSGNYESSRFGVKADHDLTGGVKATAKYEFSVNAAGDTDAAIKANRVASVGLNGGFGNVTIGMQWTPYDSAWGFDQMEYNGFSAASAAWWEGKHADRGNTGSSNAKNSISYSTPDMNGFNASVLYANSGNKATNSVAYVGLGANYATGPLSINFGYEQVGTKVHVSELPTALATDKTTAMIIGASYNLGVATIGAGYQQASLEANGVDWKDSGSTISVSVPVNASTTVALGYGAETTTSAGQSDSKTTAFGAQIVHNWTKQAAVYGGAYQAKVDSTKTTKIAAGLRYNF
jgi:predicted porin